MAIDMFTPLSNPLSSAFRHKFDDKLEFCRDLIAYTPFEAVMKGRVLILLHPQVYDVILASLKLISLLYLLFFVRAQYKAKSSPSGIYHNSPNQTLIFPLYLKILSILAVTCLLQCASSIFVPLEVKGRSGNPIINSIANAFGIGLEHGVFEGIALLLCFRGVGKRTTQKTTIAACIWMVTCFALALTMNLTQTSNSLRLVLNSVWCGCTFLFYLVIWLCPSKWLFRRPANIAYARIFTITHFFVLVSNIGLYLRYNFGFCFLQLTPRGVIAAMLPYITYRVLLKDCEYWLGITGNDMTEQRDAYQSSKKLKAMKGRKGGDGLLRDDDDDDIEYGDSSHHTSVIDAMKGITLDPHNARIVAGKLDNSLGVKMISFASIILDRNKKSFGQKHVILGAGSTSRVYRGTYYGRPVAVKMVFCVELTPEVISSFYHEATLLSMLQHKNILHIEGMCVNPPALCLVMELCGGSLMDLLTSIYQTEDKLNPPPRRHSNKKLRTPKVVRQASLADRPSLKQVTSSLRKPLLHDTQGGRSGHSSSPSNSSSTNNTSKGHPSNDGLAPVYSTSSLLTQSSESSDDHESLGLFQVQSSSPTPGGAARMASPHLTPSQFMSEHPVEYWKLLLDTNHYILRDDTDFPPCQAVLSRDTSKPPSPYIIPDHLSTKFLPTMSSPVMLSHSPSSVAVGGVNAHIASSPSHTIRSDSTMGGSGSVVSGSGSGSGGGGAGGLHPSASTMSSAYNHANSLISLRKIDELKRQKVSISWIAKIEVMLQCAVAVAFLHTCNPPILHLDLKSSNFLLGFDGNIKLADLELSRQIYSSPLKQTSSSSSSSSSSSPSSSSFVSTPSSLGSTSLTHTIPPSATIPITSGKKQQQQQQNAYTHTTPLTHPSNPSNPLQDKYLSHFSSSSSHSTGSRGNTTPSTAFLSDIVHDVTVYGDIIDHHYNLVRQANSGSPVGIVPERVNWLSPELILGHPSSEKADIYSLGCVFWEICTGQVPFHDIELQLRTIASIPRTISLQYRISAHTHEQQQQQLRYAQGQHHHQQQQQCNQYQQPYRNYGLNKARQAGIVPPDSTAHNLVSFHQDGAGYQQPTHPVGSAESTSSFLDLYAGDGFGSSMVPMGSPSKKAVTAPSNPSMASSQSSNITVICHNTYSSDHDGKRASSGASPAPSPDTMIDHNTPSHASTSGLSMQSPSTTRSPQYRDAITPPTSPSPATNPIQAVLKLLIAAHHFRPLIPIDTPKQLRTLIQNTWQAEPGDRPTAQEVVTTLQKIKYQIITDMEKTLVALDEDRDGRYGEYIRPANTHHHHRQGNSHTSNSRSSGGGFGDDDDDDEDDDSVDDILNDLG